MIAEREDAREWLEEHLPKAQHKKIPAILDYFAPEHIQAVDIVGARLAVDVVASHGLVIEVDANGNAARVRFPYGAEVVE